METMVVIGLALVMLWLVDRVGVLVANGAVVVLVRGFVSWGGGKPDPWPRGVQEEDRDQPWGSGPKSPTLPAPPSPTLSRVRPAVHAR